MSQYPQYPQNPMGYPPQGMPPYDNPTGKATAGMVLGIIGLIFWCIPLLGLPITIIGVLMSKTGLRSTSRGQAVAGLIMSILGLIFSLVNAGWGAYLGATGKNPLVNLLLHHH
ncbi:MAG: DUF4190 domain-containing protein [Tepidisphaeraceae bacterium]|jgi:hypothetical protein